MFAITAPLIVNAGMRGSPTNYSRRFLISMAGAGLVHGVLAGVVAATGATSPMPTYRWVVVLLPVLPLGYAWYEAVRFGRTLDELQRRVQLEGLAWAAVVGGLVAIVWSWLQEAGLFRMPPPVLLAVFFFAYALGVWRAARRYR